MSMSLSLLHPHLRAWTAVGQLGAGVPSCSCGTNQGGLSSRSHRSQRRELIVEPRTDSMCVVLIITATYRCCAVNFGLFLRALLLQGITQSTLHLFMGPHVDIISQGSLTQGYSFVDFSLKIQPSAIPAMPWPRKRYWWLQWLSKLIRAWCGG